MRIYGVRYSSQVGGLTSDAAVARLNVELAFTDDVGSYGQVSPGARFVDAVAYEAGYSSGYETANYGNAYEALAAGSVMPACNVPGWFRGYARVYTVFWHDAQAFPAVAANPNCLWNTPVAVGHNGRLVAEAG